MANSLNTIAGDLIAAKSLEFLTAQYPLIGLIANDISDSPVLYGQTVITRLNTVPAATSFDPNVGYVASGVGSANVSVTLNKHIHSTIEFSEQEMSSTSINLVEEFGQSLAYSIGDNIMTELGALLVSGNFPNSSTVPLSGFNRISAIVKPKGSLANRKVNNGLVGLFSPNAESALWEDDSVVSLTYNKDGGIASTELPIIHGVKVSRHDSLPAGLNGAVLAKDALCFVSRTPQIESDVVNGIVRNISNEQGLTIQYRKFHDPVKGKVVISFTLMYGVAKGNAVSAQLLKQA